MKIFSVVLMMFVSGLTFSQNYQTGIGLKGSAVGRVGGAGINVKHFIGGGLALDATVGGGANNLRFDLLAQWHAPTGIVPKLDWYLGAGGMLGFWSSSVTIGNNNVSNSGMYIIGQGVAGLDYTFSEIPLNISLELGPHLGLINAGGFGFGGALAVRYVLN